MNGATDPEPEADDRERVREELLNGLEKARGCLAIAIAGESKSTPVDRRKKYLEMADYMHRYIRALRDNESRGRVPGGDCGPALDALRSIPRDKGAQFLCDCLQSIVAGLEREKSGPSSDG